MYQATRGLLIAGTMGATLLVSPPESKAIFHWFSRCFGCQRAAPVCAPTVPQTAYYTPQTCYRTQYVSVPVTTYQSVVTTDPCTGCAVTTMRPVVSYALRPQVVPFTTLRIQYTNPVVPTSFAVPTASAAGPACCGGVATSGTAALGSPLASSPAPSIGSPVMGSAGYPPTSPVPSPSSTPVYPGPAGAAPQYSAPQYGAPQYGAPQYGAPQYGAPQYGAPQYPASTSPAAPGPAPSYSGPDYSGGGHPSAPSYSPNGAVPPATTPGDAGAGGYGGYGGEQTFAPDNGAPNGAAPNGAAPEERLRPIPDHRTDEPGENSHPDDDADPGNAPYHRPQDWQPPADTSGGPHFIPPSARTTEWRPAASNRAEATWTVFRASDYIVSSPPTPLTSGAAMPAAAPRGSTPSAPAGTTAAPANVAAPTAPQIDDGGWRPAGR